MKDQTIYFLNMLVDMNKVIKTWGHKTIGENINKKLQRYTRYIIFYHEKLPEKEQSNINQRKNYLKSLLQ